MRFYTIAECEQWLRSRSRDKPGSYKSRPELRLAIPSTPARVCYWARRIASLVAHRQQCLLWITEWGVWPSSENIHLYSRLRQSYQDTKQLQESPGHLFEDNETEDLTSFLHLSILNGWGGYLLANANEVNAFFSHDGFIEFFSEDRSLIDDIRKTLSGGEPSAQ
jgi:hypothetical protein